MGSIHISIHIIVYTVSKMQETRLKTIQMTIEEQLLEEVDKVVVALDTSRSAFLRDALRMALRRYRTALLEQRHANGYSARPMNSEEIEEWSDEQVWGSA